MANASFQKLVIENWLDFPTYKTKGTNFTLPHRSSDSWSIENPFYFPNTDYYIPSYLVYLEKPNKVERKRLTQESKLRKAKIDFPKLKNKQYKMEWQDSEGQVFCGSTEELHAANPSWVTITGTTPASLKCQAASIAPFMAVYHPNVFPRVRPGYDMYLQDSGVWWEPGAAMQFNAKVWLEFQPFLYDYQFNATRITDIGTARFKKLSNLARAGLARIKQIEHNPHAPTISVMATPKDASELLATFPTADSIIGQALWRVPFGCDYLLQIMAKLLQLTTLRDDNLGFITQAPQYDDIPEEDENYQDYE